MNNLRKIREEQNIELSKVAEVSGYSIEELTAFELNQLSEAKALLMDLKVTQALAEKLNIHIDREIIDDNYEDAFASWFNRMISHTETKEDVDLLEYNREMYGIKAVC